MYDNCLTKEEMEAKRRAGNRIQIIDVRNPEEFQEKHIPGAMNIPLGELEKSVLKFDSDVLLVTACGKGGGRSAKGAETLRQAGFQSAWLCGGTFGWFD